MFSSFLSMSLTLGVLHLERSPALNASRLGCQRIFLVGSMPGGQQEGEGNRFTLNQPLGVRFLEFLSGICNQLLGVIDF